MSPLRLFVRRYFCCLAVRKSTSDFPSSAKKAEILRNLNNRNKAYTAPNRADRPLLLGPQTGRHVGKKCLALDLDETLVHSSFQPVKDADYVIPVLIEGTTHNVYVLKRPGVDEFLARVSEHYEIVIYTASLGKYADPLLDQLDPCNLVEKRLFREDCVYHDGHYVKDLSLLNRDVDTVIIVDNSPMSYIFHPENAIDCSSFIDSKADKELWQIGDFLVEHSSVVDVRTVCRSWREWCRKHPVSRSTSS